jgi:archaellum component FlaF (FlaF/FlaG flagellin family)
MKTLLISLVSDQTVPNVQLINEFKSEDVHYQFITTNAMEAKGCRKWIETAANITCVGEPILVNEYSYDDIQQKLNNFDFSVYEKCIVNLTGGTKVMTIAAHEFFKEEGADIYYVTGVDKKYIKVFPGKKKIEYKINKTLSVEEYLIAYGFNVKKSESPRFDTKITEKIFELFMDKSIQNYWETINFLRNHRKKGLRKVDFNSNVELLLENVGLTPQMHESLTAEEVKYLTGEWFEQYIYNKVKFDFELDDTKILMGVKLNKDVKDNDSKIVKQLLQTEDVQQAKPDNEIDVIFMFNGNIYIIECKSSIIDLKEVEIEKNGQMIKEPKEENILGETIYKSDSIKNKFGLFAQSYICTLTNFAEYVDSGNLNDTNNKKRKMEELINRASLSRVSIIDGNMLSQKESIKSIILPHAY